MDSMLQWKNQFDYSKKSAVFLSNRQNKLTKERTTHETKEKLATDLFCFFDLYDDIRSGFGQ